nr:hypothetical protein [Tanacetum cinerariifolium]
MISAYAPQVGLGKDEKKTLWDSLDEVVKGDAKEEFTSRFVEGVSTQIEVISASGADTMWNTLAIIIKDTAKDYLGNTAHRESWWLCEEVQSKVAEKQARDPDGSEEVFTLSILPQFDCYYSRISQSEVKTSLQKIGRNKAVGRSSIEAIHLIRSLMEKYRERQRDLHLAFLDLEKAYDSVPRELIWKTLIDKGTSRRYIKVIKDMYDGARTRGHLVVLIFADDIALVSESAEGLNNRLENWREALEDNGLRVSREKTEYLRCDFGKVEIAHNEEVDIRIGDKILQPMESFGYYGSMIHISGRIEDVSHCIKTAWLKWRAARGVICDRNIPRKLKGKFYKVAIRPSMLYGSECWPITKALANRIEVAKLRMLRWTCGKTMLDMIPNGVYRA